MPGVNKVEYYGETLIDLTEDSVTPETLAEGATAHDAAGNLITGIGKTTSVLYTQQTLSEDAQAQARENIGAVGTDITQRFEPITAESSDGVAYTATVPWITELAVGARFTMSPNKLSTSTTPTLNVNGLGAKGIRCITAYNSAGATGGAFAGWLSSGKPVDVIYNGTYWLTNIQRTSVDALYGSVKIANGGTGATDATTALSNLGGVPKTGGTMEGALVTQGNANYTIPQARNVVYVQDGGSVPATQNGDLVLFYT